MQTATSKTESKSHDLSICVHHYTLRAPCPQGQGIIDKNRPIRFEIKGLIIIILPAPRNNFNHTSDHGPRQPVCSSKRCSHVVDPAAVAGGEAGGGADRHLAYLHEGPLKWCRTFTAHLRLSMS